jgi:hypothetical protein
MSIARTVCLVLGAVYILVGILGFIPGVAEEVAGVDEMESATALLLGIFPINLLHNIVHLVIGAVLLWGATATDAAVLAARGVGVVYLLVGLLGFVAPDTFGLMPIGGNDIWLHLATALVLLVVGFWPEASAQRVDAARP